MHERLIFIGHEGAHKFCYQIVDTEFKKTFIITDPTCGNGDTNVIISNGILQNLYETYKHTKHCAMKIISVYCKGGGAGIDVDIRNTDFYKAHQKSMDKFMIPKKVDVKYSWRNTNWDNTSAAYNITYQGATTTTNTINLNLGNAGRYVWGTTNR